MSKLIHNGSRYPRQAKKLQDINKSDNMVEH